MPSNSMKMAQEVDMVLTAMGQDLHSPIRSRRKAAKAFWKAFDHDTDGKTLGEALEIRNALVSKSDALLLTDAKTGS